MISIIIFIGLIIGLNYILLQSKTNFPKVEKAVVGILITSTILFLTFVVFEFNGYRLKGLYIFTIISFTFIISTILFLTLFKNKKKKIITVFLLTPLLLLSILKLILGQVLYEQKIDEINKISVTTGGFLSCGEILNITQTKFGLFDKKVYHIDNLCLIGITKIETVKLDNNYAEFLIYHNGQNDTENPYKYTVERKNGW